MFFVTILFIDLSIAMFDEGFIHFGYLIGEFIAYLYGLYLLHINVQIQFVIFINLISLLMIFPSILNQRKQNLINYSIKSTKELNFWVLVNSLKRHRKLQ